MRLDQFNNDAFDRGRPRWVEALWLICQAILFSTSLPGSGWRCWLLKRFGAEVGTGVVIKPSVRIKFPWKLVLGDHCWLGERAWLDNLDWIRVGPHSCVSQGAYLCTGNHDWVSDQFDLMTAPITVEDSSWVGAFSRIAPGVTVAEGSVIAMGAVLTESTQAEMIYAGNPAQAIKPRYKEA